MKPPIETVTVTDLSRYCNGRSVSPAMPWHLAETLMAGPNAVHIEEAVRPALERNFARSATHVDPDAPTIIEIGRPPSANALKVSSILTALWLDRPFRGCYPSKGEHADACPHQDRRFTTTVRRIALEAFGRDAGDAYAQTIQGLAELANRGTRIMEFDPRSKKFIREAAGTLGEYRRTAGRLVSWTWGDSTYWSLLGGGFQRIPQSLILGLTGRSFLIWEWALTHSAVRHIQPRYIELVPNLERLGLDRINRPSKVHAILEQAARTGNSLQKEWHIEVADRVHGRGWKLLMARVKPANGSRKEGREFEDSGTSVRGFQDAIPRESGGLDGFLDISPDVARARENGATPSPENRSAQSAENDREQTTWYVNKLGDQHDAAGLTEDDYFATDDPETRADILARLPETWLRDARREDKDGWTTSDKQRARLLFIEKRGLRAGCDSHFNLVSEAVGRRITGFEEGGRNPQVYDDPFEDLFEHDAADHPMKARLERMEVREVPEDEVSWYSQDELIASLPPEHRSIARAIAVEYDLQIAAASRGWEIDQMSSDQWAELAASVKVGRA